MGSEKVEEAFNWNMEVNFIQGLERERQREHSKNLGQPNQRCGVWETPAMVHKVGIPWDWSSGEFAGRITDLISQFNAVWLSGGVKPQVPGQRG